MNSGSSPLLASRPLSSPGYAFPFTFHISSSENPACRSLLFPEEGISLHQACGVDLDAMPDFSLPPTLRPPIAGDYLRVDEYLYQVAMPWTRLIRAGDRVTNSGEQMLAASHTNYAKWVISGHTALGQRPEVLAFYKIQRATTAVPILPSLSASASEFEVLFPQDSCFLVQDIAVAQATQGSFPALRVGVLLEQVASGYPARDIHTGQTVSAASGGDPMG